MTEITRLEPAGTDRVRVHLDGEPGPTLSADRARELELRKGRELDACERERLLQEGEFREALDRALGYLAHRSRSERELERYLQRKGWGGPVAERVVERCRELGYVDDREYAVAHVRDRIRLKPRGRFRLRMELRRKGVSDRDAEAAIDRAFREEDVSERDLLERAARKRWESRRSDDPRTVRRRLVGYLRRRGFRGADIRDVVDGLMGES